jgi:hypothetical protein
VVQAAPIYPYFGKSNMLKTIVENAPIDEIMAAYFVLFVTLYQTDKL